jgi:hypothetical protein
MSQRKPTTLPIGAVATPLAASAPESTGPMRFTKRFNVQITGTMANFESEGPSLATWRPVEGQHVKIFTNANAEQDLGSAIKVLRNTWLVKATVLEQKNTFPVPLGIKISCIKPQEHVETGEGYAFTTMPLTHNPMPLVIFEADAGAQTSQEWRRLYGEYNETNLASHNVLDIANQNYVFVHENHPVVSLLRANSDLLGHEMTDDRKVDGEWFKVSRQVLATCCNTLKSRVLSKVTTNDLTDLHVVLNRLDAKEWTEHSDVLQETMDTNPQIIDKPCSFMTRLEMTYELQN